MAPCHPHTPSDHELALHRTRRTHRAYFFGLNDASGKDDNGMLSQDQHKLVEQYTPLALSIARKMSSDDEAEGVALCALCEAVSRWTATEKSLPLFVYQIVYARVKTHLRAWRRHTHQTNVDLSSFYRDGDSGSQDESSLPVPDHLKVVSQCLANGLSVSAIQRETGLSRRAVEAHIRRIESELIRSESR